MGNIHTLQDVIEIEKRLADPHYGQAAYDAASKEAVIRADLSKLVAFVRSIGWPGQPGQGGSAGGMGAPFVGVSGIGGAADTPVAGGGGGDPSEFHAAGAYTTPREAHHLVCVGGGGAGSAGGGFARNVPKRDVCPKCNQVIPKEGGAIHCAYGGGKECGLNWE